MSPLRNLAPRTLLVRTFLLLSGLLVVCIATWAALFAIAEKEPRARQLGQLTVSVVNLTRAALLAANPDKRMGLLQDLAESEGVHIYPVETGDTVIELPQTQFFTEVTRTSKLLLGARTRLASSINGQKGLWVSFSLDDGDEDEYWLMLPGEHAESTFPLYWLGWGGASLIFALIVAWIIVSRVNRPLRNLAIAAKEVGQGRHPEPIPESGAIELRQLAVSFNRMSDDLKRMDTERAEVLAGISHDLRTPLARLRLEAEMSVSDENARNAVIDDIEQIDAILGQFLDYARGTSEPFETIDPNTLLTQAAELGLRQAGAPAILRLAPLPSIPCRRQALFRAVTNLLGNARKYGNGSQIEIESELADNQIVIAVMDRGPGIPRDQAERLKRPFTRLESARSNVDGTGLGLAIVERTARMHNGRLTLLPRAGGGLIARLILPIPLDDTQKKPPA